MNAYDVARHALNQAQGIWWLGLGIAVAGGLASLVAILIKAYNNRQFDKRMHRAGVNY